MRVACIQLQGYDLAHAEQGLRRALDMIDDAADSAPELIVLPECSYPAYFLRGAEAYAELPLRPWPEIIGLFGEKARRHRCHVAVGLAQPAAGCARNLAVLFGPDGTVIGSTAKRFLWHFDRYWFEPGEDYSVFDTELGRVGLIVCADGRMPEIARVLALRGAQILIDTTALVTGGGNRETLSNPQIDYMLPVRALENGVWIVAANKVGLEADSILYCGRNCVIDPNGEVAAMATPDREEILVGDIEVSPVQALPMMRHPDVYGALAEPTESLPVAQILREPIVPEDTAVRLAAVQLDEAHSADSYRNRVSELLDTLTRQDVQLIVLPGWAAYGADEDAEQAESTAAFLASASERFGCGLAAALTEFDSAVRYRTGFLWDSGRLLGKYRKVHEAASGFTSGAELPIFETRFGRLGMMLDDEGLLPEVARCLMLKGADIILWPAAASTLPLRMLARCRADENKVSVVLSAPVGGGTAIVNPNGALLVAGLPDVEQAIAAQVPWAFARYKEMAPGTHVVWGRAPEAYADLVK